jgi:hypothetical protein
MPTPTNTAVTQNYLVSAIGKSYSWKELQKIDAVITSKQHVSGVYSASKSYPYGYSISTPVLPPPWGVGQVAIPYTKDLILEHSYAISNHLVNQLNFGFVRYNDHVSTVDYNKIYGANSAYGIQGLPPARSPTPSPSSLLVEPIISVAGTPTRRPTARSPTPTTWSTIYSICAASTPSPSAASASGWRITTPPIPPALRRSTLGSAPPRPVPTPRLRRRVAAL